MELKYLVIRTFPYGFATSNLQLLENALNAGYTILQSNLIKNEKNTFIDYILVKKTDNNEEPNTK